MQLNQATILAIAALVACILLLVKGGARTWAIVATVAAGVMVAVALRLITFSVAGFSLNVLLGGALAVAGGIIFSQESQKIRVASATVVVLVGVIVLLAGLKVV